MQLAFQSYGSGFPLLILHGLLGAGGNWHALSQNAFGKHFQVFAIDQRNHGRSPHSDTFDYTAMVADLIAFMDDHGLEQAHLLGHSMGGKTAMHAALNHPQRVAKLVVIDIAPRAYPRLHDDIFAALRGLALDQYGSRADIDAALARDIHSLPVRQFLLKNLAHDAEKGYHWKNNLEGIYRNYDLLNEAIPPGRTFEGPTRFIRGAHSPYMTDDDLGLIHPLFPQADLVTIPKAGHWVHADQPEAFAEAVLEFLTA